jgi:Group II intron, maturase-specific domain
MGGEVRRWRIHCRTTADIAALAEWINPVVRGWMNYCVSRGRAWMDWRAVGLMV